MSASLLILCEHVRDVSKVTAWPGEGLSQNGDPEGASVVVSTVEYF